MKKQKEDLFMISKSRKPTLAEWTLQNGIILNQNSKPKTTTTVGAIHESPGKANQNTKTRDPFLEGFYSVEDKPETEKRTYLQHRETPAPLSSRPERKRSGEISSRLRTFAQNDTGSAQANVGAIHESPVKTHTPAASAQNSPVKIVGDNVTEKDYEDFLEAFRKESTGDKLGWVTEQSRTLGKSQKNNKKKSLISQESMDKIIHVLDAVTEETRRFKREHLPQIEMTKFSMNPSKYIGEAALRNLHYSRNYFNESAPESITEAKAMGWIPEKEDHCHQVGVPGRTNIKYIPSNGGKGEQIFKSDETVDTSAENMATPNWVSPQESLLGHGVLDFAPWVLWGNNWYDSTSMLERIVVPLVYKYYEDTYNTSLGDSTDFSDM